MPEQIQKIATPIKITEAPRDAMQGIKHFIPTRQKAQLINDILQVGFDIVDFGSFVSPKAIPQLRDTAEVIGMIDITQTQSKLMAIIGNLKGARTAASFDEVTYLGFPFSFSETFLKLNINSTLLQAQATVEALQELCAQKNKKLLVYLSMAFGNPYGDAWSIDLIIQWIDYLCRRGIHVVALSDIIGVADGKMVGEVFRRINSEVPCADVGLHLHTHEHNWYEKVDAAYKAGCRRFDGVMSGLGGCPMAGYELVGNLNTRHLIGYCDKNKIPVTLNREAFDKAFAAAVKTYSLAPAF
ncbi:MAG: hydroxymethylglutaryl-CoA lyase [Clostridia bacterium]|nr:hydroxymethylglutaryl-CoA lyase [Clostridia bacterium]